MFDSVRHFIGETQFKTSVIHLVLLTCRLSNSGGKSKNKGRSVPDTPEQHQEVDFEEEGEEADTEDQQDEKASETLVVAVLSKFIV